MHNAQQKCQKSFFFSGKSNTFVVLLRNILNYLFASLSISFWNSNCCFKSISWKYACCFVSCVAIDAVFSASLRTTTVVSLTSSCFLLRETFVISWKGDGRVGMMLHAGDGLSAASCEVGWTWASSSELTSMSGKSIISARDCALWRAGCTIGFSPRCKTRKPSGTKRNHHCIRNSKLWGGGISMKRAKSVSHIRSRTLTFFIWGDRHKNPC